MKTLLKKYKEKKATDLQQMQNVVDDQRSDYPRHYPYQTFTILAAVIRDLANENDELKRRLLEMEKVLGRNGLK